MTTDIKKIAEEAIALSSKLPRCYVENADPSDDLQVYLKSALDNYASLAKAYLELLELSENIKYENKYLAKELGYCEKCGGRGIGCTCNDGDAK